MFPNLRRLAWKNNQTHLAIEFLRMTFVPSLVSLDLQNFFDFAGLDALVHYRDRMS